MKIKGHTIFIFFIFCFAFSIIGNAQMDITQSKDTTTQSENSVFISRTNPSNIAVSNNSSNWRLKACDSTLISIIQLTADSNCPYYLDSGYCDSAIYGNYHYNDNATVIYGADDFLSNDGGNTWTGVINGLGGNLGDPSVAGDFQGNFYIAHLTKDASGKTNGVGVSTYIASFGKWYNQPTILQQGYPGADKEDIWIDNKKHLPDGSLNHNQGSIIIALSDAGPSLTSPPSIDYGYGFSYANNNIEWPGLPCTSCAGNPSESNMGVNVKTSPNGSFYSCWATYVVSAPYTNADAIWFQANRINYSTDVTQSTVDSKQIVSIQGIEGEPFSGNENMYHNSFPSMAVNQQNGDIFIVYAVYTSNEGFDINMVTSKDTGATWSAPVIVGNQPLADQWQPWIACDETSGALVVEYYSEYDATAVDNVYAVASISYDEGKTWIDKVLNPNSGGWNGQAIAPPNSVFRFNYAGDYIGVDVYKGNCVPVWSDNVSSNDTLATGECSSVSNVLAYTAPFSTACAPDWTLSNNASTYYVSDSAFYNAQDSIAVAGDTAHGYIVQNSGYATMYAGRKIELGPGFRTNFTNNGYFHATVDSSNVCTPVTFAPPHHRSASSNNGNNSGNNSGETTSQALIKNNVNEELSVFPNPSTGSFTLQLMQTSTNRNLNITSDNRNYIYVFNTYGQLVFQSVTNQNNTNIDLSGQPKGLYLVRVQSGSNVFTKKLFLQ
jgi:hypothetical protein